jgi:hypothetical protein
MNEHFQLGRRPIRSEGSKHFVEIFADDNFIILKVVEPEVVATMCLSKQRKQITQSQVNAGGMRCGWLFLRIDSKMCRHGYLLM